MNNIKVTLFILSTIYIILSKNITTISPTDNSIITSPLCTLSVTTEKPTDSVKFFITYRTHRGSKMKKLVGTIKNEPFKMLFSSKDIGNQYFFGADLIANIYRSDDTLQIVNSKRLFFLPNIINRDTMNLYPTTFVDREDIEIDSTHFVKMGYSSKAIDITYTIKNIPKEFLKNKKNGVLILIDPLNSMDPYPSSNTIILSLPFIGNDQLITTSIKKEGKKEKIVRKGTTITLNKENSYKEGTITGNVSIPNFLLGGKISDTIGINIIFTEDNKNYSLVKGPEFYQYTPILFPKFIKSEAPIVQTKEKLPYTLIAFIIGLLLSAIIVLVRNKSYSYSLTTQDDNDLLNFIHKNICNPTLNEATIAKEFGKTKSEIKKEIKGLVGKSVKEYIAWARIEIVKERLILSNSSEVAIAKDCGFTTVMEMEELFHHFMGIAPYQYREKNSLTS